MSGSAVLYTRDLPGGGYVIIEAVEAQDQTIHARLCVERRADPTRRSGHAPLVIAEAEGSTETDVYAELYPIAADNVAVARGILRVQARRGSGL
jgi:hypothetical protein